MPEEIDYSRSALYDAMVAIGGASTQITGVSEHAGDQPRLGGTALGGLTNAEDAAAAVNNATAAISREIAGAGAVLDAIARALDNTERGMATQSAVVEAAVTPTDAPPVVRV